MTQQDLADVVGVSRQTMSDWENRRLPSCRDDVVRIAEALELNGEETNALLVSAGYAPNRLQSAHMPAVSSPKPRADVDEMIASGDALWGQAYADAEDAHLLRERANRLYQQAVAKVVKPSVLAADLQRKIAWYYRTRDQIGLAREAIAAGLKDLGDGKEWEVVSAELVLESAFCAVRDRDWQSVKNLTETIIQRFLQENMPDIPETYSVVGRAYNMLAFATVTTREPSIFLEAGYQSGWMKARDFLYRADADVLTTQIGIRDVESNLGLDAFFLGDYDRAIPLLSNLPSLMLGTEKALAANNNLASALVARGDVEAGDIARALEIFEENYKTAREVDYLEMQMMAIQGRINCWKRLAVDYGDDALREGKAAFLLGQRFLEEHKERLSQRFGQYSAEIGLSYAGLLVACGDGDSAESHFPPIEAFSDDYAHADFLTTRAQLNHLQNNLTAALNDIQNAKELHLKTNQHALAIKDDLIHAQILLALNKTSQARHILTNASVAPIECAYLIKCIRQLLESIEKVP